jgi:Cytochrome c7 and related cytochrome c
LLSRSAARQHRMPLEPHGEDTATRTAAGPLFPIWGTTVFRVTLVVVALTVLAIPSALWAWERTPYVAGTGDPKAQPVKFDHRHHVRDNGIPCLYCHRDAERSSSAGMPAVSLCMGCHAQVWTSSPELAEVRRAYFDQIPLAWERVSRLPDFVFFDHASHVTRGVGCVTCHGRVDLMAEVYAVSPFTMDFCLDCHRSPEKSLRPQDKETDMEWVPNRSTQAAELTFLAQHPVHPGTDCTSCHR